MMPKPNQAVILCGGLGTRLGSLTKATPKPLLLVAGTEFLDILINEVIRQGVKNILLLAGFESGKIFEFRSRFIGTMNADVTLEISVEPERAGTGGALWYAKDKLEDVFYLLNGDSWFDFRIHQLYELLLVDNDIDGAIALRRVDDAGRYGQVRLDGNRIVSFNEKAASTGPQLINSGVYLLKKKVMSHLSANCSLESDVLPEMARKGLLGGVAGNGYFIDIGIPSDYEAAQIQIPLIRTKPAVFFDRDGVLNIDKGHVGTIERFEWIDGAREAILSANKAGYYVFVVTNQAGIAKGLYTELDYRSLTAHVRDELATVGAHIDDERFCPFHPDAVIEQYRADSNSRKPWPGMILDILNKWPVDASRSFLVGDKETDLLAAKAAGVLGFLYTAGRLDEFVEHLIAKNIQR